MTRNAIIGATVAAALMLTACSGEQKTEPASGGASQQAAATGGPLTPDPGGEILEIDMITDGEGNFFAPAEFDVRRGDVIRWKLVSGVHNANFLVDSNPGVTSLPPMTPLLQLPGQTFEVKVDLPPGRYYYHCDPHALIGMVGWVTVR